ncbi:deoxyhypusine synthase family protein [Methanopyrus sp.]
MSERRHFRYDPDMSVDDFLRRMGEVGALGAGRLARAAEVLERMWDSGATVLLTVAGPAVAGGLRDLFELLIREGLVDAVITSGANVVHDALEALGGVHVVKGRRNVDGYGRVYDVHVPMEAFERFERFMRDVLRDLPERVSGRELLWEMGRRLEDGFLRAAAEEGVPVYSPGLLDSMVGLHVWLYAQDHRLELDLVDDMHHLADLVFEADELGAIMLGGSVPKHFAMGAAMLRGGLDYAVQITMDRPETGSLSGAPLEEGKSWDKVREDAEVATVIGDYTVLFPLLVTGVLQRLGIGRC